MSGVTPEHRAFVEASMGILMAVIMADGKYTQDEFSWWKNVQTRHPLFKDVPADVFNPMLQGVKAQLAATPWPSLVTNWAKAVPSQFRKSIFELAADLVVVDGELEGKEPEVIKHIWQSLQLPDDEARKIFMAKIEAM